MNIFIDTNVFLAFYHLTSEDLEELKKLSVLLEDGRVTLFLPDQVVDEYRRNRESKIAAALKSLKEQKLKIEFPVLCKDYEEYQHLRELQKQYETKHASLLYNINRDIENDSLKADQVIGELFDKARCIESTDKLIELANRRVQVSLLHA